jgi:hypothetical protein
VNWTFFTAPTSYFGEKAQIAPERIKQNIIGDRPVWSKSAQIGLSHLCEDALRTLSIPSKHPWLLGGSVGVI